MSRPGPSFAESLGKLPPTLELSPDDRLLLHATLLPRPEAFLAWSRWSETHDLTRLRENESPLIPRLYKHLGVLLRDHRHQALLKGVYRHAWARHQVLLAEGRSLLDRFAGAGVPCRPYGLTALHIEGRENLSPTLGAFTIAVDPAARMPAARQALHDGWRPRAAWVPLAAMLLLTRTTGILRLHKDPELRLTLRFLEPAGVSIRASPLSPERSLIEVLTQAADSLVDHKLPGLAEIVELLVRSPQLFGRAIDIGAVASQLAERRNEATLNALLVVAQSALSWPIDETAEKLLDSIHAPTRKSAPTPRARRRRCD